MPSVTDLVSEAPKAEEIHTFLHCILCEEERPKSISAEKFSRIEVGFTPTGIQVWCIRHSVSVGFIRLIPEGGEEITPYCDYCARGIPHPSELHHN